MLVGDIHLSDRPPASCTDSYLEDLFVILDHVVRLTEEYECVGTVWSGDVFHHKQPTRNSHRLVQRAVECVQRHKKLWIVPGNHDMLHDRFDSIKDTQPLGVLFQAGAELLQGWERTGEHPIYGVPWMQRWDEATVENALYDWIASKHCYTPMSLVVAHAPLYPPGLELPYEYYPTRDEETALGESDYVDGRRGWSTLQRNGFCYYGHVHEAHGTYEVEGVTYCNQGAVSRGSLHESELSRAVAVTTWSPEEGFRRVEVPHKPADEVFRLMEVREREDQQVQLDEFLASVGRTSVEVTSVEAVVAALRSREDLQPDVVRTCEELLRAVETH
jgi:hypothetical protein